MKLTAPLLIVFLLMVWSSAQALTMEEKMAIIRQQEVSRREQVRSVPEPVRQDRKKLTSSREESPTLEIQPALPESKDAKTRKPEPALVSDMSQASSGQQEAQLKKNVSITGSKVLIADQLWQGQRGTSSDVTQYQLFIEAITDEELSAILNIIYRGDNELYVVKGSYDRINGKIDLRTVDHLSSRAYEQPQLVIKISGDKQILNTEFRFERNSFEIGLNLISGADSEIREVLEPARVAMQAKAEQRKQHYYYQTLVITPEFDEYGLKTLETIKLENEKRMLRPLSTEEYGRVKTDHENEVNRALAQKQQQLAAEQRVVKQKKQEHEAQLKQQALVAEREKEELIIFNELSVADASISREDIRKIVENAGGNYIDPEQLKQESQGLMTVDDPSIDLFDTSDLLPGTSTGVAYFFPVKSMFWTDEVFASFVYKLDDLSTFREYQQKLLAKYGSPSEQGPNSLVWTRDSGKSGVLLLAQPPTNLLEDATYSLMFMNQENMEKIQKSEEVLGKKQNSNF